LPAEGGLDEIAISYTKGCYLGQEVMARLKNLGQVRRQLHLVRGKGVPPPPGTALHQGERKVGELRSAAADGDGFLAMAMLSLVNLDENAVLSVLPGDPAILRILRRV
jgi:folate-binding Fe-S cluster repair protein YgfZ